MFIKDNKAALSSHRGEPSQCPLMVYKFDEHSEMESSLGKPHTAVGNCLVALLSDKAKNTFKRLDFECEKKIRFRFFALSADAI